MIPITDEGTLSPSGHVSKRYRRQCIERARRILFGAGLSWPQCPQETERERLLRSAAMLRDLAARGMGSRKHAREAARLEAEIEKAERGQP